MSDIQEPKNDQNDDFDLVEIDSLNKENQDELNALKHEKKKKNVWKSLDHSKDHNESHKRFKDQKKKIKAKKDRANFKKNPHGFILSRVSGRIFLIYIIVVIVGMILLSIPGIVVADKFKWDFLTSLFQTSSAFSDTGISIVNASADYSFWGQLILLFLIMMGGLGILTFKIVIYLALNKRISIDVAMIAQSERGSSDLSSTVALIRDGFVWLTMVQIFSTVLLFFAFYFTLPSETSNYVQNGEEVKLDLVSAYHNFAISLWFAIFHSTSAINNAGFDIISGSSLQAYNHSGNVSYLIQIIFLIEWVIGGLGYPTFHDIKRKIKAKQKGERVAFSLFTKLNFVVYGTLFFIGPLAVFGTEFSNRSGSLIFNNYACEVNELGIINPNSIVMTSEKPVGEAMMDIIFNVTSTRNAGFSTVNINDFNAGSKAIMGILMFIGSAPSSTAGGIRTTTLAILILAVVSVMKGKSHTTAFKKTIPDRTVKRAFGVFLLSTLLVAIGIIICYADSHEVLTNPYNGDASIVTLFVLITSAFGTVGMNPFSSMQTYELGVLTKIVIIIIMFVGQLGISNTLLVFAKNSSSERIGYLEEEVVIG